MKIIFLLLLVISLVTCQRPVNSSQYAPIVSGNDPNFKILAHHDQGFKTTNRKVVVFDIPIYTYAEVEDQKLLHAANIGNKIIKSSSQRNVYKFQRNLYFKNNYPA